MTEKESEGRRRKDIPVDEVKEILTVVAEKVPALLNSLADVLYGKEQAAKYGQAVAGFYKTLKDSGMTDVQAYELTKQYMSAMNLAGIVGDAMRGRKKHREDVDEEIERRVREKDDE